MIAFGAFVVIMVALSFTPLVWSRTLVASAAWFDFGELFYEQCHDHLDNNGGGGIDLLDPLCAQVENTSPEALNQDVVTDMDTAVSITLTGTDPDAAGGFTSDLLYFTISVFPQHGTLSCSGECTDEPLTSATLTYTPEAGYTGTDEFDFTVSDGLLENDATISITVNPTQQEEGPGDEDPGDEETPPQEETPAPAPTNTGSSNGGGGGGGVVIGSGPLSIGFVNTNASSGQVLGTSTEAATDEDGLPAGCSAYLSGYLRMGEKNDAEQVKKLQTFLNKHLGADLPVTGVFGPMTFEAVKKFQVDQWEKVLKPWVVFGLASDRTPTGYVYKTTKHTINLLNCATLNEPAPQLP